MVRARKEYASVACDSRCILNNIDNEVSFFCSIDCPSNDTKEWVLGYIKGDELVRERCISFCEDNTVYMSRDGKPHSFPEDAFLVLKSYIPSTVQEIMVRGDSVLCSREPGVPTPVELQENTVLGMLDGSIQSIDKGEFKRMYGDPIVESLCEITKPLVLNTSTLDLSGKNSKVAANIMYLKPGPRPKPAQPGTIIFNSQTKVFEGYNGLTWSNLNND